MKYAYYPGCSQETVSKEYNQSAWAVCNELGIELLEISDWNCCGASSGHSTDYWASHALAGRNIAIAEREGMDIAVVCPACFLRLKDTQHEFRTETKFKEQLTELIDMPYEAKYEVRHLLDIICNTVGIEKVKGKVKKPLTGLRVVAYYGCYLVRPPEITGLDDPENPQIIERLLEALGAEVLDWRAKVDCCGGSLSLARRDVVKKLVNGICDAAHEVGAEAIVTGCGVCDANLEARQAKGKPLPILYFTELAGLAFGLDARPWLKKHLLSPLNLLGKHGLLDLAKHNSNQY
ncbi:CoB--CoM heterodisulfide reductase iron-sulfur subunit B family protein [Chloroflexota bacterium]